MSTMTVVGDFSVVGDSSLYYLSRLGAITIVYFSIRLLCSFWSATKAFILAKPFGLSVSAKSLGSWAIVTGATDGIGKGYANELASQGVNVVLVSRSAEKLQKVASEIEIEHRVKTKCVAVDFTHGSEIYDVIRQAISGLEVGVLVNNVGMVISSLGLYFTEASEQANRDLINCNAVSMTSMSLMVLPSMVARKKGAIINIASVGGHKPLPLLSVYSATKVYVDFLSRSMNTEYQSKGIIVQSVLPGGVSTNISKNRTPNIFMPAARSYASSALATLGIQSRTFGCLSHYFQASIISMFPDWLFGPLVMKMMLKAREKELAKLPKKKKVPTATLR